MYRRISACAVIVAATLIFVSKAHASSIAESILATFSNPETELSYERAKLDFDRIIAPKTEWATVSADITKLAAAAQRLAANGTDVDKLKAIRQVLYEPGAWNNNRPFAYDQADPYGQNLDNKLLATYLRTRKGNCVSMPILHLLVAERLGLNVSLSAAPSHLFVRYTNPGTGRSIAIEPTSGGYPARDARYREKMGVTDAQVASGVYLAVLSKRESIAVMASTGTEWLMREERYQEAIEMADVLLEAYPKDIHALLLKGSAYAELLRTEFVEKYPRPNLIPSGLQARYRMLVEQNDAAFRQAEAWGWTPEDRQAAISSPPTQPPSPATAAPAQPGFSSPPPS